MFQKLKKAMWIVLGLVLAFVVVSLICTALYVDDWSRDLSQNRAETSLDAEDPRLKPLIVDDKPESVAQLVEKTVTDLDQWQYVSSSMDGDCRVIELTWTSRIFRFVDDVTVTICPHESGSKIDAVSQSRVGKGDLGQNPRNIDELFRAIRGMRSEH